jgi:hypothetical protein
MTAAAMSSPKTYDVVVLAFRDTASEPAARAMARVIDITEEEGESLIRNAPRAVRSRVDYATAEACAASLGLAGAEVAIAEHPFDAQRRTASGEIEGIVVRSTQPGHVPDPHAPVRREVEVAAQAVDVGARTLLHIPAADEVEAARSAYRGVPPPGAIDATPMAEVVNAEPASERPAAPPPDSQRPRAEPSSQRPAPGDARSRSSFPGRPSLGVERDSKMMGVIGRSGKSLPIWRYVGFGLLIAVGYVAWLFLLDHL